MTFEFRPGSVADETGGKPDGFRGSLYLRAWFLTACILLVGGLALIEWQVVFSVDALRDDLRLKAESVARAIPANQARDLVFQAESTGSLDEVLLRNQLRKFAELMPEMFLYTVQERGGALFFGPESLAEDDPIASAVGTLYEQAPDGLVELFQTRRSGVVGPYQDEYGEFMSGFAPVMNLHGHVYFMIGVDIRKHDMERSTWALRLRGYALLAIALACIATGCVLIRKRSYIPSRFNQYAVTAMVAVLGLCMTVLGVNLCSEAETGARKRNFARLANAAAEAVRDAQTRVENYLESTVRFVEASDQVTAVEFRTFAKPFLATFPAGDLMLLRAGTSGNELTSLTVAISTCNPPGLLCVGTDITPLADWPSLLPISGRPERTVSAPLVHGTALKVDSAAVHHIHAAWTGDAQWLAGAVWCSSSVLESAKAALRSGSEEMVLKLLNIEADPGAFESMVEDAVLDHDHLLAWHHPLVSMAQSYVLEATPTRLFYAKNPLRITPSIGVAGTVLTMLVAVLVFLMQGQNKLLHRRVAGVTGSLVERERLLEAVLRLGLRFVNYPSSRIEQGIQEALAEAGAVYGVDRAYVFSYDFEQRIFTNTHEWCRQGVNPVKDHLQNASYVFMEDHADLHRNRKSSRIDEVATLPDGTMKDILDHQGVQSLITVPLFLREECIGFIGFDAVHSVRHWTEDEQIVLTILAELIANAMDRKIAEDSVIENKSRLTGLFLHSKDAIVFTDDSAVYLDVNPAACALTGRSHEEMIGSHPRVDCDGSQPSAFEDFWKEVLSGGHADCVLTLRRADGKKVMAEVHAVANILPGPHVVVLRDATERRHLQQQLEQSQRLDSLGRLASGVAHELNNVLSPILMGCDLVRAGNTNPQLTNTINIMEDSSRRGAAIIRQILTFARGSTDEQRRALDLHEVVRNISNVIGQSLPKTINLLIQDGPPLPKILADRTGIEQVIMNLCINARDAMRDKGTITIGLQVSDVSASTAAAYPGVAPGRFVKMTVSDTGEGIPSANLDRIFEPFFTTKELGKGTGLGLSVLQGIIRTHHGFIKVSSTVGEGSRFAIYLPVADTDTD